MSEAEKEVTTVVETLASKTIAEVLAERITTFSTSEKMLEIIDKKIEACLTGVIDDALGRYSDFSKGATDAFKKALPGNIDSVIDLGRYNSMVQDRLRAVFASSGIANDMVAKAEKALKDAMQEELLPPVIKMSTLLEAFIECHAEEASEDRWERPDFRLKESESILSTEYQHFYFDKQKEDRSSYSSYSRERSDYQLANRIDMRAIEGEMIDGDQVYEVYSAQIEDKLIQHFVSTDLINTKWEKMMFALYYGQSKICIDCDPDDYTYPWFDSY